MTCYRPDPAHSTLDVPLELAHERIAALRGETRRSHLADEGPPEAIRRLRHGIGRRLIAIGSALAAEQRPHTLAR